MATLPTRTRSRPAAQEPTLSDMVRRAIEFLELHERGYCLVVDAELISRAAEQNDGAHVLTETVDMDRAIARPCVMRETNRSLCHRQARDRGHDPKWLSAAPGHGVGLLGVNAFGYPALAWTTGPLGPQSAGHPRGRNCIPCPIDRSRLVVEPAAFYAPTAIDSAEDVIAIGKGPGTEALQGVIDNTQILPHTEKGL